MMAEADITVTDPQKCSERFGTVTYISYKINSYLDRANFAPGSHSVVRRYSDFSWLAECLAYEFPGVIVPPLPEKQQVGRFAEEFLDVRRRALERFMLRVSAHSELGASPNFAAFLQADEARLAEAKKETKVRAKASTWTNVVNVINSVEIDRSGADIRADEIKAYITVLEKHFAVVIKHAEALVRKDKDSSAALLDFSQGVGALGASE
ncbi:Phox homologous domain-containing protein, partial [Ochromonadaceae sp. CCMP2298]